MASISALNGDHLANRIAAFNWRGDGAYSGARRAFAGDALAIGVKLPRLDRIGSSQAAQVDTFDNRGRPAQLNLNFTKTGARTIRVDVTGAGVSAAGSTRFDIRLNGNGKIQGFDTDGSGTIDAAPTAAIDLDGHGNKIRFQFDNSDLGPLNFGTLSLSAEYLSLLQEVSGKLRSAGVSVGAGAGPSGPNVIDGTAGDDVLASTAAEDLINGYAGNDTVDYSGDVAAVNVDLGNQTGVDGSGNTDTYTSIENAIGSGFDDTLTGSSGANDIAGGAGNDTIDGASGNDTLDGGIGNDFIDGGVGNDSIAGGTGNDTINGANDNDTIDGGDGNDLIDGGVGNDSVAGGTGNDTIDGANGNDTLDGGDGNDSLTGGTGTDSLAGGAGNDSLDGGANDDTLAGGTGNDTLDGGAATDTADYSGDGAGVTVDLATGTATDGSGGTDSLNNIENITGSGFADDLTGDGSANVITGGAGSDTVAGGSGNDTIDGGTDNDTLNGDAGNDVLTGGLGNDSLDGGGNNDTLTGGIGADTLNGGWGTDTADYSADAAGVTVDLGAGTAIDGNGDTDSLSSIENVTGSGYNDNLTGDGSNNVIAAGAGNDTIVGGAGNDTIDGGSGTDTIDYSGNNAVTVNLATGTASDGLGGTDSLSNIENVTGSNGSDSLTGDGAANVIDGGNGNDTLTGGGGDDTLTGGSGDDQFILDDTGGNIVITDFTAGWSFTDELDFSNVASINNYSDVYAATTNNSDGDAVIDLGNGTTVTLIGVSEFSLNRFRDFRF